MISEHVSTDGPYLRLASSRDTLTAAVKNKPTDCKVNVRYFQVGEQRDVLVGKDAMDEADSHSVIHDLRKGTYRVTAELMLQTGKKLILEEFAEVEGKGRYDL